MLVDVPDQAEVHAVTAESLEALVFALEVERFAFAPAARAGEFS